MGPADMYVALKPVPGVLGQEDPLVWQREGAQQLPRHYIQTVEPRRAKGVKQTRRTGVGKGQETQGNPGGIHDSE